MEKEKKNKIKLEDMPFSEGCKSKTAIEAIKETKYIAAKNDMTVIIGEKGAIDRDPQYTLLLKNYINEYEKNSADKRDMKKKIFFFLKIFFPLLTLACIAAIAYSLFAPVALIEKITFVSTSLITFISSFIVIPLTITKHLFPENIDNQIVEVVKNMIENDKEIRKCVNERNKITIP